MATTARYNGRPRITGGLTTRGGGHMVGLFLAGPSDRPEL